MQTGSGWGYLCPCLRQQIQRFLCFFCQRSVLLYGIVHVDAADAALYTDTNAVIMWQCFQRGVQFGKGVRGVYLCAFSRNWIIGYLCVISVPLFSSPVAEWQIPDFLRVGTKIVM